MEGLRQSLHSHGYVRIPPEIFQLDPVTIQELRNEFDRLFHGHYETGIYPDEIHWRPALSKDNVTRELCNAWKASNVIAKIVCGEKLGQLASSLMGWSVVRIGQDDVLHKPPLSNAVGFHQDGAYISDNFVPSHDNCLTMWIALDDADQENGALQYAPGSHHWPYQAVGTVAESSFHFLHNENEKSPLSSENVHMEPLKNAAVRAGKDHEEVIHLVETVAVPAGQMVVHHQNLWHGSGPNISTTRSRRALVAHLIDGEVVWRTDPPPHYIYGRYYIRGESILRDDFFPIVYSQVTGIKRTEWLPKL
ncbi:mitomycin antibiotics/polyketide fumonisin biosynthesis protein [Nitzschia inconspicua]|uniref:Mitomycin antibiotics/polyketide fumonisin biosynthesis protein n=1 Tax=Nitzschia inconspicua TaxID=303405 RepID=A0A9K3Q1B3_9STRA|nr:mitomycin antibiotics/polyketide fumonisin biosynthesis protein [Nitzschia inconspicua]